MRFKIYSPYMQLWALDNRDGHNPAFTVGHSWAGGEENATVFDTFNSNRQLDDWLEIAAKSKKVIRIIPA